MENFNIPFAVRVLDKLFPLFFGRRRNYEAIRKILVLKFTLDNRRKSKLLQARERQKGESSNVLLTNTLMFGVVGLFISAMQISESIFLANTFSFASLIFILSSIYIAEYSSVLLDTTERSFYGALPLSKEDLAMAKNIHIAMYIFSIALPILIPSAILGGLNRGILYALAYSLVGVMITIFCVQLAGGLYFGLLKIFSGEKLKDILNYFQVVVSILVIAGYQIIPRIPMIYNFHEINSRNIVILCMLPSSWYSAMLALLFGSYQFFYIPLSLVGITVQLVLWVFHQRILVPQFEKQLAKLDQNTLESKSLPRHKKYVFKLFSKNKQERAFMELVSIHLSRDRSLKLKLYPQLANQFILPIIMLLSSATSLQGSKGLLETIRTLPFYLILYINGMVAPNLYYSVCETNDPNTTWIYRALPFESLKDLIKGGIKVVVLQYLTPVFMGISAGFLMFYRGKIGLDILIIYFFILLVSNMYIMFFYWDPPFSIHQKSKNAGRQLLVVMLNLLINALGGFIHFYFIHTIPVKLMVLGALVLLNIALWKWGMNKEYILKKE